MKNDKQQTINHKKQKNSGQNSRISSQFFGFILVEVIVAIGILMLAVPAALTIASKSVFLASYSKDQIIATYLAQEGLEIIRNHRDQNILRSDTWLKDISPGDCAPECIVAIAIFPSLDPLIAPCVSCSSILYNNTASGAYAHSSGSGWVPTKFSRVVRINSVLPNEIRVHSIVTYSSGEINKTVAVITNLTEWME